MSNSQGERREAEGTRQSRPSNRLTHALAEMSGQNRLNEDGANCSGGLVDASQAASVELQRTIDEVGRCAAGNDRLAAICARYVEALNAKHRLAQRLRDEQAKRAKVLETKNRLMAMCRQLQEQTRQLRNDVRSEDRPPNGDDFVARTPLGIVRKYVDFDKYLDKDRQVDLFKDDEYATKSEVKNAVNEDTDRNKRSLPSVGASTETKNHTDCKAPTSEVQSQAEESDLRLETQIAALVKATSVVRLSEEEVAVRNVPKLAVQARNARLSLVTVTRSDIPPATQGYPIERKIRESWAAMDLTRR